MYILKLDDSYKLEIAVFMYKSVHRMLPSCCLSYTPIIRHGQCYATRASYSNFYFVQPRCRTNIRERCLAISGSKLWNSIPDIVKNVISLNIFKKNYSQYLTVDY